MIASEQSIPKVGVGVMVVKDGKVLLALRKASHGAGGYQFPGGHLEHLESFEECARREVREECGIEIDNIEFVFVANVTAFAPKHYIHLGLKADWKSGEPQQLEPEKSGPWEWYSLDALPSPLLLFCSLLFKAMKDGTRYFDAVS
ncbi:MAG: NUDIX domain-containing protein [Patescibacteria group bacterium]